MSSRNDERERRRQERLTREAEARGTAARRRRLRIIGAGLAAVVAVAVVGIVVAGNGHSKSSHPSTAGAALLASTNSEPVAAPVDGIQCESSEQVLFHIHAHLAVFVNGRQRVVPAGIGIAPPRTEQESSEGQFVSGGACFYWLHSHTADGIIHIESPVKRTYTLGDYFDVWGQPLGRRQVGPARGDVVAYLNGRRVSGDPRSIPLTSHALVQLDVGAPAVPAAPFTFPPGL